MPTYRMTITGYVDCDFAPEEMIPQTQSDILATL